MTYVNPVQLFNWDVNVNFLQLLLAFTSDSPVFIEVFCKTLEVSCTRLKQECMAFQKTRGSNGNENVVTR